MTGPEQAQTLREAYLEGCRLLALSGADSPRTDAGRLLERAAGNPAARFSGARLEESAGERYFAWIARRCAGEPLQYILGEWEFYSLPVRVEPGVLIPRPETELLVEAGLSLIGKRAAPRILDLCTGSGCIAAALGANRADAAITAADFYEIPLRVAAENLRRLGFSHIRVEKADALKNPPAEWDGAFDLLASNPPYLSADELQNAQRELSFEPPQALLGGTDGLDFYRAIAEKWHKALAPGGFLALEIGCSQAEPVAALLEARFGEIRVLRDYSGLDRVITARLKSYHTV